MKIARTAAEQGYQIHEHTMSDWTILDLLAQFELLNETIPLAPLRCSLAHVYTITPESIERANKPGLTIAVHGVAMYSQPTTQPPLRTIQDSGIIWRLVSLLLPTINLLLLCGGPLLTKPSTEKVLAQTVSRG